MPSRTNTRRGVSACPQAPEDAVIHQLTYNAIGAFARFVERAEACHGQEARLAAELAFALSNFLLWQRLAVGDRDEATRFYGATPANLSTLARELRRVGNLARGKAKGQEVNDRLPLASRDSVPAEGEADFWRGMAEHFIKNGGAK